MTFIQIIEFTTTHIDDVQEIVNQWAAQTEGRRKTARATLTQDRDRPDTYLQIVEFPSYDAAMANSELSETAEFAKRLADLCATPPVFRDLEVRQALDLA
jgi:quinol monooxygenase YgiN